MITQPFTEGYIHIWITTQVSDSFPVVINWDITDETRGTYPVRNFEEFETKLDKLLGNAEVFIILKTSLVQQARKFFNL